MRAARWPARRPPKRTTRRQPGLPLRVCWVRWTPAGPWHAVVETITRTWAGGVTYCGRQLDGSVPAIAAEPPDAGERCQRCRATLTRIRAAL